MIFRKQTIDGNEEKILESKVIVRIIFEEDHEDSIRTIL